MIGCCTMSKQGRFYPVDTVCFLSCDLAACGVQFDVTERRITMKTDDVRTSVCIRDKLVVATRSEHLDHRVSAASPAPTAVSSPPVLEEVCRVFGKRDEEPSIEFSEPGDSEAL